MCTRTVCCSAENLLAAEEVEVRRRLRDTTKRTDSVSIRLPVKKILDYEARADGRQLSLSTFLALELHSRLPEEASNYALAALGRLIAIHHLATEQRIDRELISELTTLVSALARSVRESSGE